MNETHTIETILFQATDNLLDGFSYNCTHIAVSSGFIICCYGDLTAVDCLISNSKLAKLTQTCLGSSKQFL